MLNEFLLFHIVVLYKWAVHVAHLSFFMSRNSKNVMHVYVEVDLPYEVKLFILYDSQGMPS